MIVSPLRQLGHASALHWRCEDKTLQKIILTYFFIMIDPDGVERRDVLELVEVEAACGDREEHEHRLVQRDRVRDGRRPRRVGDRSLRGALGTH